MVTAGTHPAKSRHEKAMSLHPSIGAALAEQHQNDLIAHAEKYRLARAARSSRATPARQAPGRLMTIVYFPITAARRTAIRVLPRHWSRGTATIPRRGAHTAR